MPFDFAHMAVPFRMQPGLRRLPPDARHLSALAPGGSLFLEKQSVSVSGQAVFCEAGFDASDALASIARQAIHDGVHMPSGSVALELLLAQDLAVLDLASGGVPWMNVCVPSGWAPEEKIGRSLLAIHAPVADNGVLAAAWPRLAQLLTAGGTWERHVWSISPSPRYDQHPHRHPAPTWPTSGDLDDFASRCYLRSERQTFFPVLERAGRPPRQAIFTITPSLERLPDAVSGAQHAQRLHQSLASMSDAVVAYKNLAPARVALLAWLKRRMGESVVPTGG